MSVQDDHPIEDVPLPDDETEEDNIYVRVYLDDLKPYPNNPRINAEAIPLVENSIRDFGYRSPIVVNSDMVILAGHTRYESLKKQGRKTVKVIIARDMTELQSKGYRLVDNKAGEYSSWDWDSYFLELAPLTEVYDMADYGFGPDLLDEDEVEDDGEDLVPVPDGGDVPVPSGDGMMVSLQEGDVVDMGDHILVVAPADDENALGTAMGLSRPSLAMVMPAPHGATGRAAAVTDIVSIILPTVRTVLAMDGPIMDDAKGTAALFTGRGCKLRDVFYWNAVDPIHPMSSSHVHSPIIPLFAYGNDYEPPAMSGMVTAMRDDDDIPAALVRAFIDAMTDEGDSVMGTGGMAMAVMRACMDSGRTARLVIPDPVKSSVIVSEYIALNGADDVAIHRNGHKVPMG